MTLKGKRALITGAAGFLGVEQAVRLAESGCDVVMLDAEPERGAAALAEVRARLSETAGEIATAFADVGARENLARTVGGDFDILVNNVGYVIVKPIEEITPEEFERQQKVNAHSAFYLAQQLAPAMKANAWGRIVNIGSTMLDGMFPNFSSYLFSKGSLLGLTRALARELGPSGVTANMVSPGALESPAERNAWGDGWAAFDVQVKGFQSVKRRGGAADIAHAVHFLCQDQSGFISGQQLRVDGGWMMA